MRRNSAWTNYAIKFANHFYINYYLLFRYLFSCRSVRYCCCCCLTYRFVSTSIRTQFGMIFNDECYCNFVHTYMLWTQANNCCGFEHFDLIWRRNKNQSAMNQIESNRMLCILQVACGALQVNYRNSSRAFK